MQNDEGPAPIRVGDDGAGVAKQQRISFVVDGQGHLSLDDLTAGAQQRLEKAIESPRVRERLRLVVGNTAPDAAGAIDPIIVNVVYDAIGSLAASVAVATGHTVDSAKLMAFTDAEKQMLIPPTMKVLAKYGGGAFWAKWQDEIGLALILVAIGQGKVAQLVKEPADVVTFPARVPSPTADEVTS